MNKMKWNKVKEMRSEDVYDIPLNEIEMKSENIK